MNFYCANCLRDLQIIDEQAGEPNKASYACLFCKIKFIVKGETIKKTEALTPEEEKKCLEKSNWRKFVLKMTNVA